MPGHFNLKSSPGGCASKILRTSSKFSSPARPSCSPRGPRGPPPATPPRTAPAGERVSMPGGDSHGCVSTHGQPGFSGRTSPHLHGWRLTARSCRECLPGECLQSLPFSGFSGGNLDAEQCFSTREPYVRDIIPRLRLSPWSINHPSNTSQGPLGRAGWS